MNNPKPNITLFNISDCKTSGLRLSVKKVINELFRKRNSSLHKAITKSKEKSPYRDMLSVIICTTRKAQYTEAVIASLDIDNTCFKTEIIVVNNTKNEFRLDNEFKNIKIVNEPALGLSKARNRGAEEARGEYLLYMDDDALANTNLLTNMYNSFIKNTDYVIIGGQIFLQLPNPTPNIFLNGKESLWRAYTVPYKKFKRVKEQYELPYGACFGMRHSFLDKIGGFPENYGRRGSDYAGGEETAVCLVALRNGLKVGIEPRASVSHAVDEKRFCAEHVLQTTTAGIVTTYRLFLNGYIKSGWTPAYIGERIGIIHTEISRLGGVADTAHLKAVVTTADKTGFKTENEKIIFYKLCELYAFERVQAMMKEEEKCLS